MPPASFSDILARMLLPMSLCFICRISHFAGHLLLLLVSIKALTMIDAFKAVPS